MIHKNTLAVAVMESTLLNNSCTIKGISFFEELFILKSTREYRRDKKMLKHLFSRKYQKEWAVWIERKCSSLRAIP